MHTRRFHILLVALVAMMAAAGIRTASAQATTLCYTATGECIGNPFTVFWPGNGGLPVFGYPVRTLAPETNPDTGQTYLTQWFERERLELHPENAAPYTVLLGRLGVQRLQQQGRDWTAFPKAGPGRGAQAGCRIFASTGHSLCGAFRSYWQSRGLDLGDPGVSERESLALFGYPISEPATEVNSSGDNVLTQWFERARFEFHPNNPAPYTVLLGLLGNEVREAGSGDAVPFYEDRTDITRTLISYYNAINRKEYRRAYDYWESPGTGPTSTPPDYATFVQGYANTASVAVTFGAPFGNSGAGNYYADVPTVIVATQTDGRVQVFSGCYVVHSTNPDADPRPGAGLWRLRQASIRAAPAGSSPAALIPDINCQP